MILDNDPTNPTYLPPLSEVAELLSSPIEEGEPDLIPGLLPRTGQLVIAGETNVGKSLVALEIVSCLTTGKPLWGELKPLSQAKKVLYILGEHHNDVIKRLWQTTQLEDGGVTHLIGPQSMGFDKSLVAKGQLNPNAINKMSEWASGADLVIFDPLAAFIIGQDVENDNNLMRMLIDAMGLVTQNANCASLILAHQGKPMMDRFGKEHRRKNYATRGASAIEDAATNIFYMAEESAKDNFYSLNLRKYKGVAPEKFALYRNPHTLTHTMLNSARPSSEARKVETQIAVMKMKRSYPDLPNATLYHMVSLVLGVSERTVFRYMEE